MLLKKCVIAKCLSYIYIAQYYLIKIFIALKFDTQTAIQTSLRISLGNNFNKNLVH